MTERPNICAVGLKCYDLFAGAETPRYIGGIETQLVLLTRALAADGCDVSLITYDHGQADRVVIDGVTVVKAYRPEAGFPVTRFFYPRWTHLARAMRRADADVYWQMGAGLETGQIALWCRRHRRRFIFATASDSDCMRDLPLLAGRRERWFYRMGLRRADRVICQTETQQIMLEEHFATAASVVRGFAAPPAGGRTRWTGEPNGTIPRLLWVGRIAPEKRPELLLRVTERLPNVAIDVVGDANADNACAREFRRRAAACPSVVLHGKVPAARMETIFRDAAVLISTSAVEGFPVTFIEAWSRGIPVVATVDPDGSIIRHQLGLVAADADDLADKVRALLAEPAQWRACSARALQHYEATHTVQAASRAYRRHFDEVVS